MVLGNNSLLKDSTGQRNRGIGPLYLLEFIPRAVRTSVTAPRRLITIGLLTELEADILGHRAYLKLNGAQLSST